MRRRLEGHSTLQKGGAQAFCVELKPWALEYKSACQFVYSRWIANPAPSDRVCLNRSGIGYDLTDYLLRSK